MGLAGEFGEEGIPRDCHDEGSGSSDGADSGVWGGYVGACLLFAGEDPCPFYLRWVVLM